MATPTQLPLAGTPGKFDPRNPTLLPNFNRSVANNAGPTVDHQSPQGAANAEARADATATATIGGTVTTGDEVTLEVSSGLFPGGLISHTYTTVGGDTTTTIAEALANLFNDDPLSDAANLSVDVAGAVLTFQQNGPLGNFSVVSSPLAEPAKVTIAGTALTNDQVNVLFAGPALGPVMTAEALAVVGGVVVAGDTNALTFTNTSIAAFPITKTYTAVLGDTDASIAAGLLALIQGDATLKANGVEGTVNGATLTIQQAGAIGNSTVLSFAASGAETMTFDPSNGHLAGGAGQPGGVLVQVTVTTGQSSTTIAGNLVTAINANAELASLSITAANTAGVVNLTVPAAAEPLTITSWVNSITPTATITGSVAAGDVLNLTFTAAYLPGGTHSVSHTALVGETTTTLANNLVATINADSVLIAAGIGASNAANVITFSYQANAGQLRYSQSVSPGSETITLSATPTTTAVTATTATETVTLSPSNGAMSGGTGPVFATNNFEFAPATGGLASYFYGQPYDLGYDVLSQMVAQGMPIT